MHKPWYKRWWAILLYVILGSCVLFTVSFLGLIGYFYYNISSDAKRAASLAEQEAVDRSVAETEDDPSLGSADATVVIVAFSDFACPYCKKEFEILTKLAAENQGRVRLIWRDLPIEAESPLAFQQSLAANCANAQKRYWDYAALLFKEQDTMTQERLFSAAEELGLEQQPFRVCMSTEKFRAEIESDQRDAVTLGISATPSFVINGYPAEGEVPEDVWRQLIDDMYNFFSEE